MASHKIQGEIRKHTNLMVHFKEGLQQIAKFVCYLDFEHICPRNTNYKDKKL